MDFATGDSPPPPPPSKKIITKTKKKLKKKADPVKRFFDKMMKPINKIINYFKCGIRKIKNLGDCILFYIIDMIVGMYFVVWNIFASIFGLKKAGQELWKFINKYQKFGYPRSIMKKCYLC